MLMYGLVVRKVLCINVLVAVAGLKENKKKSNHYNLETVKKVFIDALLATYTTDTRSNNAVTDQIYTDNEASHKITNHPVHIFDKTQKKLSPSSFIPFCDFAGNKESMGRKIDQFHMPVCNSFEAKVLNDQLCYEVDPNSFVDAGSDSFSKGLTLFIDNNVERMYPNRDSG